MEEHSKEFLEKLKGLLAFAKEHKNALEHQEIVDYFKGISLTETQSEKILDYLDEHGVDVLRQKDADARCLPQMKRLSWQSGWKREIRKPKEDLPSPIFVW